MQNITLTPLFTKHLPWGNRDNGARNRKLPQYKLPTPFPPSNL